MGHSQYFVYQSRTSGDIINGWKGNISLLTYKNFNTNLF